MSQEDEKTIQKYIFLLSENANIELVELPKYQRIYRAYRKLKKLYETGPELQTMISNLINEQFRPTVISIGTLGAFLFGCHQFYYGSISKTCSPLCIGNLYASEEKCSYQIWIQRSDLSFRRIGPTDSQYAYIFLFQPNYMFSSLDIQQFKEAGIIYIQIIQTKNSKHAYQSKLHALADIPVLDPTPVVLPTFPQNLKQIIKASSSQTLILLFILLVIIVLILAVCYFV